jgi:hypothetical protein
MHWGSSRGGNGQISPETRGGLPPSIPKVALSALTPIQLFTWSSAVIPHVS